MNKFEQAVAKYLGLENLRKVQPVKVGIAGAGGLGSNCAQFLVRSGFKHLVLADFDRVEYSNLNRQFFFQHQVGSLKVEALAQNLKQINPDLDISTIPEKLDQVKMQQVFKDCDVVIEAFDDAVCKRMLVETYLPTNKLLVSASGLAGWGESDNIKTRKVRGNFYLVGDTVSAVSDSCPPVAPRVTIAAAKQADIVLNWVLNQERGD